MKTKLFFVMFVAILIGASSSFAADPTLTVSDATIEAGQEATVTITVDDASLLAGAAFTIKCDNALSVKNVESSFFDTFVNQGFDTSHGLDAEGKIEGFDSPLVTYDDISLAGTTRIAAARKDAGSGTDVALFTLTVAVAPGTVDGTTHNIEIIPTTLNNISAGYLADGEEIPLLVGYDGGAADEYPTLLDKGATAETVFATGTVTVGASYPLGDPSGDNVVNATDALWILNLVAGNVTEEQFSGACDVNGDGSCNATDALWILNVVSGNISVDDFRTK